MAAEWLLTLFSDPNLTQVWCETQDDVTLIWECGGTEEVEFVQVKSADLDQLWTVAELCKRDGTASGPKIGTSILERSLAHDRNQEKSSFRVVTRQGVKNELSVLTLPWTSPARISSSLEMQRLCRIVDERLPGCISPNGNDEKFWIENTRWQVSGSLQAVNDANVIKLHKIAESMGELLVSDQLDEAYCKILSRVRASAEANWNQNPHKKKIKKGEFCEWLRDTILSAAHPAASGIGRTMARKMTAAGLPDDYIRSAKVARQAYRRLTLRPQYQALSQLQLVQEEIVAKLQELRSQLDTGNMEDIGVKFHARCLAELETIRLRVAPTVPSVVVQGYMYVITDRCLHRFRAVAA